MDAFIIYPAILCMIGLERLSRMPHSPRPVEMHLTATTLTPPFLVSQPPSLSKLKLDRLRTAPRLELVEWLHAMPSLGGLIIHYMIQVRIAPIMATNFLIQLLVSVIGTHFQVLASVLVPQLHRVHLKVYHNRDNQTLDIQLCEKLVPAMVQFE